MSFLFPDGKYIFQRDNTKKWIPFKGKTFSVTPKQLESLKLWLKEFRQGVDLIGRNRAIVADYYAFSHWLNGFFGQKRDNRIQFSYVPNEESAFSLSYSLLNYSAFLKFFASSYLKIAEETGVLSISSTDWTRFTKEMFPVLAVLFQINYNDELKKLFPFLFDYGDLL